MKKKSNRDKKLGVSILALFIGAIAISVVALMNVVMLMFRSYNDSILIERAHVGMEVLEDTLNDHLEDLRDSFTMMTEKSDFLRAFIKEDASYFSAEWSKYATMKGDFFAVVDHSGKLAYKSDSYALRDFDVMLPVNGAIVHGILRDGDTIVCLYAGPVYEDGISGAIIMGLDLSDSTWLDDVKKLVDCDVSIFRDSTRFSTTITENGQRATGAPMPDEVNKVVIGQKQSFAGQTTLSGRPYYVSYEPMFDMDNKLIGAYFAGSDATDANNEFAAVAVVTASIAVALVIAASVIIYIFVRKRIITPIKQVTIIADEMENGELSTTKVDYWFENDEVGKFARKLRYAKKGVSACVEDVSGILNRMAEGNFTEEPKVNYPGDFDSMKTSILKIESDLGDTLSKMNHSSDEVLTGSNQMAEGSQSLADGTTKQASAIQEISATITEVSTQIANTAENASKAEELSRSTEEKVIAQDDQITKMVAAMDEISETSKKIEMIIKTIDDISFQTNILALNAAVEAARAGDAGKGFAVVADEVRNLASKSAEAAKSTTDLINAAIDAVSKGAELANSTAESMKEVKAMSEQTSGLIIRISEASQLQNESIKQITSGVEQISQVIQMNSATAEETAASCQELSGQSRLLKDQVARFKVR